MMCVQCGEKEAYDRSDICMDCYKAIVPLEDNVREYIAARKRAENMRRIISERKEGVSFCGMHGYIQASEGIAKVAQIMKVEIDKATIFGDSVNIETTIDGDGVYYVQVENIK